MCQKYNVCIFLSNFVTHIFIGFILRSFLKKQHSSYIERERKKIHIKVRRQRERESDVYYAYIRSGMMCVAVSRNQKFELFTSFSQSVFEIL